MIKRIKRFITREYVKFGLKQCPHICMLCRWRSDCLPYFVDEYESMKGEKKND